jgi:SAM-dependent methyltransferase
MQSMIDYPAMWRELVRVGDKRRNRRIKLDQIDPWQGRAAGFNERIKDRWRQKDSSREFLTRTLKEFKDASILDIGAGGGAWVSLFSALAGQVTAVEPSKSMLAFLRGRIDEEKLSNVKVVEGAWPLVKVPAHDICFCSHAMYGEADFCAFIQAMQSSAKKRVILLMRAPKFDGLMAQASKLVWGHPHDSPNFYLALNILWEMGIHPNVIMEEDELWKPWFHASLEDALAEMKSRLGLFEKSIWDDALFEILEQNLTFQNGIYVWPAAIRTGLIYWDIL